MTLDRSTKPVPIYRLFLRMGGWIVILVGLIFLSLSMVSHSEAQLAERFRDEGRVATGKIKEKWISKSRNPDGSLSNTYWITLRYSPGGDENISLKQRVGRSAYKRLEQGKNVNLVYLDSDPHVIELTPNWYRSSSAMKQGVALALGVVWLGLLWIIGSWSVDAVRARRYGRRLAAHVVGVKRGLARLNGQPGYRLLWRDAEGRTGKSMLNARLPLTHYHAGDQIEIFRGAKHDWWIGDVGERDGS